MRILLVEDNEVLSGFIKHALKEEGFVVDHTIDGKEGLNLARVNQDNYDVIILDILLPTVDGIQVCKTLREEGANVPILMLSARSKTENKVEGLNAGADDYLAKPFEISELIARTKALLRRKSSILEDKIAIRDLTIDLESHEVYKGSEEVTLTNIEFRLLSLLMKNKGKVITRAEVIEKVWDMYGGDHFSNTVDVHIRQLRKKLKEDPENNYIQTVRGVGYKFIDK
jgi:DNA-binding response OmpR family regulator